VTLFEFTTGTLALPVSPVQGMLLTALDGCRFTSEQAELFREAARRDVPTPGTAFREVRVIKGVRAGFTTMVEAPAALWRALYGPAPAVGMQSVIRLVAQDERGAKSAFHAVREHALSHAQIAEHVTKAGSYEIAFDTGHTITVYPSSAPALRGPALSMALMDEYGFVRHAHEIRASLRRGLLGTGGVLLRGSSPWIKEGLCFEDFQTLGNNDPDVLTLHGGTRFWNPSISQSELDAEQRIDPVRFTREYLGLFTDDLAAFLPAKAVEDAVRVGVYERPPEGGRSYVAACDMSAGGPDATTQSAIATANGSFRTCSGDIGASAGNRRSLERRARDRRDTSTLRASRDRRRPLRRAMVSTGISAGRDHVQEPGDYTRWSDDLHRSADGIPRSRAALPARADRSARSRRSAAGVSAVGASSACRRFGCCRSSAWRELSRRSCELVRTRGNDPDREGIATAISRIATERERRLLGSRS
jgi:hypothetical protein